MFPLKFINRGGQLSLHNIRMTKQVLWFSLMSCLAISSLIFASLILNRTSSYQRYVFQQNLYAQLKTSLSFGDAHRVYQNFASSNGRIHKVRSADILGSRQIQGSVKNTYQIAAKALEETFSYSVYIFLSVLGFFFIAGFLKTQKKVEQSLKVSSPWRIRLFLFLRRKLSDLCLGNAPFVKGAETSHVLISGAPGTGKSNCINILLSQIRDRDNRAVIVDTNGEFVKHFYKSGDIILNPYDSRSLLWNPWKECPEEYHFDHLASAFIPRSQSHDIFWEEASKVIFASALRKMRDTQDLESLFRLLVETDLEIFSRFFEGTKASTYTRPEGEKMTLSIKSTLANHVQCLEPLLKIQKPSFSIRHWVQKDTRKEDPPWLFLCCEQEQRESIRPLMSAWIDIALNSLMGLAPDLDRRLWFIIDELPSLNHLPSLSQGLAETRKYGGCIVAGVQSMPQLKTIYGNQQAEALLDNFSTKVFFRNSNPNTTQWISKVLGEVDITENIENLSYGANTMRDGISLSHQTRHKPLVQPIDISSLKTLESYIQLPGNLPICKTRMNLWKGKKA